MDSIGFTTHLKGRIEMFAMHYMLNRSCGSHNPLYIRWFFRQHVSKMAMASNSLLL